MKVVILAGGLGTRLSEETVSKPKPMVEIGGMPILWHIMKIYSAHKLHDFVICCGYKSFMIKQYFANYFLYSSNVTIDIANNDIEVHQANGEPWRVTLLDTGEETMTGGRLKRACEHLDDEFCFTYGDGVSDIDITRLIDFHRRQKRLATVTAVQPPGRFGALKLSRDKNRVERFEEKVAGDGAWINGGFFVLSKRVIDYIDDDSTVWEREPMERLAREGQLATYLHQGFWQPMDTLRDKMYLEKLWSENRAPWKLWSTMT